MNILVVKLHMSAGFLRNTVVDTINFTNFALLILLLNTYFDSHIRYLGILS